MERVSLVGVLLVLLPLGGLAAARAAQKPMDGRTLVELAQSDAVTLWGRIQQPWALGLLAGGAALVAAGALWRGRVPRPPPPADDVVPQAARPGPDRVEALGLLLWVAAVGGASGQAAWREVHHATREAVDYQAPLAAAPRVDGAVQVTRRPGAGTPAYFDAPAGVVQVERDGQPLGATPLSLDALCNPGERVALRFTQPRHQPATWTATCEDGALLLFTLDLQKAR
jgi:hypothetical protein